MEGGQAEQVMDYGGTWKQLDMKGDQSFSEAAIQRGGPWHNHREISNLKP